MILFTVLVRRLLIRLSIVSLFILTQTSCQKSQKTNIVILAVESLSALDIQCSEALLDKPNSGFAELCKNSVRFTHHYTTSTQSLPSLASLMTGLAPYKSQVHDSNSYVSSEIKTLGEYAYERKYKTGFISSSATVLRKNNLHQGFILFDDTVNVTKDRSFKNFSEISQQFKNWLIEEGFQESFFSVLYISDLSHTQKRQLLEIDQIENKLISSDDLLEDFDSQLFDLIFFFKKNHLWDNTMIFLVGLNGQPQSDRKFSHPAENLHSENIQTALLIKPTSKKRETPIHWKIDNNVNTLDLHLTIKNIMTGFGSTQEQKKPKSAFENEPISLEKMLDIKAGRISLDDSSLLKNRIHIIESFYNDNKKFALIQNYNLFLKSAISNEWIYFNSLVDRNEAQEISISKHDEKFKKIFQLASQIEEIEKNKINVSNKTTGVENETYNLKLQACENILIKNLNIRENLKDCIEPVLENTIKYLHSDYLKLDKDTQKQLLLVKLNQLKQLKILHQHQNANKYLFSLRPIEPSQIEILKKLYTITQDSMLKFELKSIFNEN